MSTIRLRTALLAAVLPWGTLVIAANGYLDTNQRQYHPQGCNLNGSTAICRLTVVNRGNAATLGSGIGMYSGSDLFGVQFIDNGNALHAASASYFLDRFGTRQVQLMLKTGEQGTFVVEFAAVDARVTSGSFRLGNQLVGAVGVAPPPADAAAVATAAPAATAATAPGVAPAATPPAGVAAAAPTPSAPCAGTKLDVANCKTAQKMQTVEQTAASVNTTLETTKKLFGMFKSAKEAFTPTAGQQTAQPQPVQPVAAEPAPPPKTE